MNVAYSSRYLLTVILQNNLELNTGINGNSPPINTTSHNDFLLSEMEIEYSCTDTAQKCATFPRIAPQVTALGGTVLAKSQYTLLVDLLAGEALEKMREKLGEELVAATLSVRFRGTFAHGPEFQSEPYLYGLKFSNVEVADYTCSTSSTPRLVTAYPCPLFNGQDSYIDRSAR